MTQPEIYTALGKIQAQLEAQSAKLDETATESRESRRLVHRALEEIRTDAQITRARVEGIETEMKEKVRPSLVRLDDWKSRALGALAVLGLIGTAAIAFMGLAKDMFLDIWRLIVSR